MDPHVFFLSLGNKDSSRRLKSVEKLRRKSRLFRKGARRPGGRESERFVSPSFTLFVSAKESQCILLLPLFRLKKKRQRSNLCSILRGTLQTSLEAGNNPTAPSAKSNKQLQLQLQLQKVSYNHTTTINNNQTIPGQMCEENTSEKRSCWCVLSLLLLTRTISFKK